jgi:hypothetical protein
VGGAAAFCAVLAASAAAATLLAEAAWRLGGRGVRA